MIKIGLDMMGGDFAPLEAVKGVVAFLEENKEKIQLVLIGSEEKIRLHLSETNLLPTDYVIVDAPQVIEMHEHPTKALKEKQQSSIAIGFHLLATGKTDAFISAGNT